MEEVRTIKMDYQSILTEEVKASKSDIFNRRVVRLPETEVAAGQIYRHFKVCNALKNSFVSI